MSRDPEQYRPCAGVVLINQAGLIFTGERIDTPGAWQMPQGGIDKGETPADAALRELEEETGVLRDHVTLLGSTPDWVYYDLPPHLLGKMWKGKYLGQKQRWFLMRLNTDDPVINIQTAHPEFARWRWSTRAQTLEDIVDFKRDVYASVLESLLPT